MELSTDASGEERVRGLWIDRSHARTSTTSVQQWVEFRAARGQRKIMVANPSRFPIP
jgi:hypothetical protein